MSDTTTELGEARPAFDQDWKRLIGLGLVLAVAEMFISLSNMPVSLDIRKIIEPLLSMGYLSLLWLPLLVAYSVSREVVLEGMTAHRKGAHEVVAGGVVGAIGGAGVGFLAVLIDNFDLRDPLVNWSPQLLEQITFGKSVGLGFVLWLLIGAALGAAAGSMHIVTDRTRRIATTVVLAVVMVAILETVLTDISEALFLEWFTDIIFFKRGGLSQTGALIVALLAGAYAMFGRAKAKEFKASFDALEGNERVRANRIAISAGALLLLLLPMVLGKITNELLANVGLFVLLALGLNIVVGLAGILDLGYVAFFAVGGYTTAILTSPNRGDSWPEWLPQTWWLIAVLIVVPIAAFTGLFIGAPVIRMRGDYLAIVTLGFGEIIRLLFLSDWLSGYTGGAQGITNVPGVQVFGLANVRGTDPRAVFYLVLVFCLVAIYISWRLENSRLGRAWMAIREDESVAEAMGINTVNVKLMAFVVGAILASFSGAIFAAKVGSVFPTSFIILVSIVILVVVIVGGMGNIAGVIVGAIVLIGVLGGPKQPGLLQEFSDYKLLVYGALLIWMMLKRPEGLIPNVRRSRELHQEEFLQDAWLKGQVDDGEGPAGGAGEVAPA